MFIRPAIFDPSKIIAAQSNRVGGLSLAPFDSLNLGLSVNDDEALVHGNRDLFFSALGFSAEQTSRSHQVHGDKILIVREPGYQEGYDAQVTNVKNIFLLVSVADCTPVLVHDEKRNAVAAIHAGWRGTAAGIVAKTMSMLHKQFGTEGADCKAYIGACISYENFEVGPEVAEHFAPEFKRYDEKKKKWFVDLKSANRQQLQNAGVKTENIEVSLHCTFKDKDLFFSHRRERGVTGRMMAVIGMK